MKYIEGKIFTSKQGIEFVTTMLMELGITETVIANPDDIEDLINKKNVYDWDYIDQGVLDLKNEEPKVIFYLEDTKENHKLIKTVHENLMKLKSYELYGDLGSDIELGRLYCELNAIDDKSYLNNWKVYFKPTKITERIVVKPTWENYIPLKDELVVTIDPGMAFGTGTHETTSLCLKLMEKYDVTGKKVLDVGSGSGIIAATAGLLGAEEVLGIEIDPIAIEVGRANIALNQLTENVTIVEGDLTKGITFTADMVVANLMADLVILLSGDVGKHISDEGIYISSGILTEKLEIVQAAVCEARFEILEIVEDGGWCAIAARKSYE